MNRDDRDWVRFPDLAGKVALVTGGSRGIGAATCRALAANGALVAVNGREREAIDAVVHSIVATGGQALGVACDVTDPEAIRDMRGRIERELGVVQILAPFAGGQGRPVATVDIGADLWRAVLDSDLTSVYLTTAAFLPGMIERGEGSIVMISSTAGRQPSSANAAYAAAKAGVVMLSKHLANEVGRQGVRVNCIAPSAVLNDRMQHHMSAEQLEQLAQAFPLGRIGQPADIAQAVLFLASSASSWITGGHPRRDWRPGDHVARRCRVNPRGGDRGAQGGSISDPSRTIDIRLLRQGAIG